MAVFASFLDVLLVIGACLGSGFLICNLMSRFVCNLPDSRPKVAVEAGLHGLSAILGILILFRAILNEGQLFVPWPGRPWMSYLWFGFLGISLFTFLVFTFIAIHKRIKGPFRDSRVIQKKTPVPYRSVGPPPLPRVNQLFDLELIEIELHFPDLHPKLSGMTVGHLTDFHLGNVCSRDYVRFAVDRLMEKQPELIAVTGDFVNFERHLESCFAVLESVSAPLGVFVVRGNHDYWVGEEEIKKRILALGFTLLHDRTVEVERKGATFLVSGVESPWNKAGIPFDFIPRESDLLKIVLSHTPDEFPKLAKQNPHLVLSGHTHGGQICLPFFGPVVVPSNYGRKYERGFFKDGESLLYVSKGIGCHPPLRTLCKPEVTLFRFVSGA